MAKIKALSYERSELRYATARAVGWLSSDMATEVGPLSLALTDPPELPSESGWHRLHPRLSGICGSDLSTIACETSRYFEPLVSFPFVMGHEIVGDLSDGSRVVIDAVLGHAARGVAPPHAGAAPADGVDFSHNVLGGSGSLGGSSGLGHAGGSGHAGSSGLLEPGIQTGNCASTGGGWSEELVVHESQIHQVPKDFSDEAAVLVEPCASGIHAALKAVGGAGVAAAAGPPELAVVIGAGTIGLCALAYLRKAAPDATIVTVAKYPTQRQWAGELGADVVAGPGELRRAVRRITGCAMLGDILAGGADITIDAVGSGDSLTDAIAVTRPRGRIVLSGMPGSAKLDLAPLWHRETELVGAYTYGTETLPDNSTTHTFNLAFELIGELRLERLVSASYRLQDWRQAIRHAMNAGELGLTKVVFDLRS